MNTGRMRHIITLQEKRSTIGEYGGMVDTWQDVATVWASVEPLRGRELFAAQAAQSVTTVRFRIWYMDGVSQAMRILFGSKVYNIESVIDINHDHTEIHLLASTGLNEG